MENEDFPKKSAVLAPHLQVFFRISNLTIYMNLINDDHKMSMVKLRREIVFFFLLYTCTSHTVCGPKCNQISY